ncbi:hypothetical protein Efla_004787 [Eimeria flavescens]
MCINRLEIVSDGRVEDNLAVCSLLRHFYTLLLRKKRSIEARTAKELRQKGGRRLAEMSIQQGRDVETETFLRGRRVEDNVAGSADIDVATVMHPSTYAQRRMYDRCSECVSRCRCFKREHTTCHDVEAKVAYIADVFDSCKASCEAVRQSLRVWPKA